MNIMKKRKKSILLLAAAMGIVLLTGGCAAKEKTQETSSETFVNEAQPKTVISNEEPENAENAPKPEPASKQETKQTSTAREMKYLNITHVFKPYEQAVEISLQIPEDWKYTIWDVEEEAVDWGYSVNAGGREDSVIRILGQFGTLTADGYSNGPESFQISQGLTGQYSWDEYILDDGNPAIQGMIVLDTELAGFYGVSFNMPKSVYSENKNIIDNVFQSIVIKEAQ